MPYSGSGLSFSFQVAVMPGLTDHGPIQDLHVGVPSASVQLQNATAMPLIVSIGTDEYSVTSQQATTLPLPPNGAGLSYSLTNEGGSEEFGSVTVVWLLDGQLSPQPDGPLTGPPTGDGGGGTITNYALEHGGNLQQLERWFGTFSDDGLQAVYYDTDTTITLASGMLVMGSVGTTPGTAVPGNAKVLQTDDEGRLVLAPGSLSGDVTIVSPLDGSGWVEVDVKTSVLPTNAAQETGGNLATLAATVESVSGSPRIATQPSDDNGNPWDAITTGSLNGGELGVIIDPLHGGVQITNPLDGSGWVEVDVKTGTVSLTGTLPAPAAPSNASNISASSLQVKNAAGTLYGLTGYSSISQYLQLLDATALVSGTTVPKVSILLLTAGSFALDYGTLGRAFGTGIYVAFSSTEAVFTTGTAGTLDCQYV